MEQQDKNNSDFDCVPDEILFDVCLVFAGLIESKRRCLKKKLLFFNAKYTLKGSNNVLSDKTLTFLMRIKCKWRLLIKFYSKIGPEAFKRN